MAGFGGFKKPGAVAPGPGPAPIAPPGGAGKFPARQAPAAAPRQSRWAGVSSSEGQNPMLEVGTYRVRITSCEQGHNPGKGTDSVKVGLEVVSAADGSGSEEGHSFAYVELISGKGMQAGMSRTKAFIVAASGFEDDASFDVFCPTGGFIDACLGVANEWAAYTIVGRLVDVMVQRGQDNPKKPGDWFRIYHWAVVADEDQDQVPNIATQAGG
jgi:hypothetical protein